MAKTSTAITFDSFHPKPCHKTTAFTFDSFNPKPCDLTYQGDASPCGDVLSLTSTDGNSLPQPSSVGRVLYSHPVQFWEYGKQANFQTTFTFKITQKGNSPAADGLAFFIAPVGTQPGSAGASLGIFNAQGCSSNTFAVEFDSYVNSAWDPLHSHIGINVNSRESKVTTKFEDFLGKEVTATITYMGKRVTVVAWTDSKFFNLSYDIDLTSVLPQQVQVGISAATGQQVQNNYLYAWSFTSNLA